MEFISVVNPAGKQTTSSRKVHSHAAKVAHARSRRLRMAQYWNENGNAIIDGGEKPQNQERDTLSWALGARERDKWTWVRSPATTQMLPQSIDGAFEHQPLAGFLKSLTAKERFMFNHYIQVVLPASYLYCSVMHHFYDQSPDIWSNWILIASTEIEMLQGFLLTACRHLSQISSDQGFYELAIQYKLRHVQSLRETMLEENPSASRAAVTKALVLATDDIMNRDLPSASQHVLGALRIIQAAGGAQALGVSDLVSLLLQSQIHGKGLFRGTKYENEVLLI